MAVAVRLMRLGKRHMPVYRIIVIDKRKKRNSAYLENIGTYNPMRDTKIVEIKKDRLDYWISRGAQVSEGLRKLLKQKSKWI